MNNPDSQDQTMSKLRELLSKRFGKNLELQRLIDVSEIEKEGGTLVRRSDLLIPLRIENAYLGTAVIPTGADLSDEHRLQVAQVVRMILEPKLYRDFLETTENNLQKASEEAEEEIEKKSSAQGPVLLSHLIHLHAHDPQRIKRSALVLHEMTERWAFAPLSDVAHQVETASDLRKLGAITLFVEDVETLSEKLQTTLLDFLELPKQKDDPLIITASSKGPQELLKVPSLLESFVEELTVNTLELDRISLSERGLREVLNLMFFQEETEL